MTSSRRRLASLTDSVGIVVVTALVFWVGTQRARADGPVGPGSLPGGVTVADSDPVSGEQWGRLGGRTIQYMVLNPSNFTSLTWGAVGAGAVGLAFDGAINVAGETLTLDVGSSDLPGGVAVWSGTATLPLTPGNGQLDLPTRFTLTVDDGSNNPIALSSILGGNEPGLDVLGANATFRTHLLFEANHTGAFNVPAGWTPVLDLFDDPNLPTISGDPPGQGGPVLTSFNDGFFFDVSDSLSLEQHDTNLFSQTNMIKGDLAFLTTDAINRLQQLATGQQAIHDWVNGNHQAVLEALNQLAASFPEIPPFPTEFASSEDVQQVQDGLTDVLLILFGLAPCPEEAPCTPGELIQLFASPEDLELVRDDVQTLLNKVMEIQDALSEAGGAPELEVQVVSTSSDSSGRHHRWLLNTTLGGTLVDAILVRAVAVTVRGLDPATLEDVTMLAVPVALGPGLVDLSLTLPTRLRNTSAFQLDFFFDDGSTMAHGSALVTTDARR